MTNHGETPAPLEPIDHVVVQDRRTLPRRIAQVLVPTYLLVLLSFALPQIPLDGRLAMIVLRVSDTGTWPQMPMLCIAALMVLTSRLGISLRRRAIESMVIIAVMLGVLGCNALLNEHVIKPSFEVPRPNIIALVEHDALGPAIADTEDFYALGDKQTRREFLAPRLAALEQLPLAPEVRAHWAYETGYSFPSGHATASMTFATLMLSLGLCWLHGWRRWVMTMVPVWAICVVYSRPLLQVHTAYDVCVGALIGVGWGLGGFVLTRWTVERLADE